ncbi:hypothetical protein AB5V95_03195 [Metamycoplasma spumans]|uniref:hypothetical protein n=1 Tax=Metamycoplasma spumans TaxID=92406 RepID=UPI0034DD3B09
MLSNFLVIFNPIADHIIIATTPIAVKVKNTIVTGERLTIVWELFFLEINKTINEMEPTKKNTKYANNHNPDLYIFLYGLIFFVFITTSYFVKIYTFIYLNIKYNYFIIL